MDSSGEAARRGQKGHPEARRRALRTDLGGLYHLGRTLGRGHFAVVKLARQVNTGDLVAVKMIDKTKLDLLATSHLLQEVRCMQLVQHPNVVRLYEVIDTPTTLYLVMELAEGGDLYDYIVGHEGGVAEDMAKRHFAQIVRAVAYCHRLHVVHRDLKPENVVFFPQQGAVKLTDFGFSNLFQPGTMLATSCGSLAYSAPEILLGEEYDAPAVDIWSLGVILYMLVCGVPPFQETNDSETLVMILDCRYCVPEHVSHDCKDLITRMLQKAPAQRASLAEIEAHRWLQGLDDALLSPEAPPPWLSLAVSPSSPPAGLPECGDLRAARPSPPQTFPRQRQPKLSFTLHPAPTEEPPVSQSLAGLQQICEEEEEGEEEEEEEEGEEEEKEEEEEANVEMVVSNQQVSQTHDAPPEGRKEKEEEERKEKEEEERKEKEEEERKEKEEEERKEKEEEERKEKELEANNNNQEPPPVLLEPPTSSVRESWLRPKETEAPKPGKEGEPEERKERGRDGPKNHKQATSQSDAAPKAENSKRPSGKLRQRLLQFPLCEKALALNTPPKPPILPLAQYNCCRVL